ncbi:multifunctional CCA addition/repair protein [Leptothrix ochracea]|uniref:multifunctional CCA addition/repair protein n=1 Tax=Leptothrix ochracea TaxID=735331 RepID=UPI0034E23A2E
MTPLKIYRVGGAVRDRLLGLAAGDQDWVVVGSTPEAMLARGFVAVGQDFPVFLHPHSHEEYALARTERKSGLGYRGFVCHASPEVTLEDDLARRDLTVNAMAEDDQGRLIDPWGGERDLHERLLRHVGPAFAEDPVRILRLARFAARFSDFRIAPETMQLCRQMVDAGEVDALVPERVWQELSRGLMTAKPSRMFEVLRDCGALKRLLPEVDQLFGVAQRADYHPEIDTGVHVLMVLDMAAQLGASLGVRLACLCHDLGKGTTPADVLPRHTGHEGRSAALLQPLLKGLRVPTELIQLADLVAREHGNIHRSTELSPEAIVRLLGRCDAWRRPERFAETLLACECDARGRGGDFSRHDYPQRRTLGQALALLQSLDQAAIVAEARARGAEGPAIARALDQARAAALSQAAAQHPPKV